MKKIIKYLTLVFLTGAFAFGLVQNKRAEVRTEAAIVQTSRLWAKIVNKDQWDAAGASTNMHYWGDLLVLLGMVFLLSGTLLMT